MKTILLCLLVSFNLFAADGLTIPNSFKVDKAGQIYRGREPKQLVSELKEIGITDVIIFKNEVKDEVTLEKEALKKLKIKAHHVPFRWKEYPSMEEACGQVVKAINLITKIKKQGGKVFFHCTAGEDRTGTLAGLYRMLEEHLTLKRAFRQEMCARGFADGNPNKPSLVTSAIEEELTPLFSALAQKIQDGEWILGKISVKSCQNLEISPSTLRCH